MDREQHIKPFHDDIALVAQERDRCAFRRIFDHFAPRVNSFLIKRGAGRDLAEDLVQDVFVLIWRRAHQFDGSKASLSTWIYTIARNRWVDVIRRDKHPDFEAEDPSIIVADAPRGDTHLESIELQDQLRVAIDTLPKDQSDMLRIFYFEDKSHSMIAEELDLPLGTVKSRLRLALAKLKNAFSGIE